MSQGQLPKKVDPIKLAANDVTLSGTVELQQMPRLVSCIEQGQSAIDVQLRFFKDEQGIKVIQGTSDAVVEVICQRCLGQTTLNLKAEISLALLSDDSKAQQLPNHYDPLIIEQTPIILAEIIEEELLLCLPSVPMHDADQCSLAEYERGAEAEQTKRPNPFQVLADLKKK